MTQVFIVRAESDVRAARAFVTAAIRGAHLGVACDDAALLTSELVTNALRYGGTPVTVRVEPGQAQLVVSVDNPSPGPVARRDRGIWADGGRGLDLVDQIADGWGVRPLGAGKQVWFRLAAAGAWPDGVSAAAGRGPG